MRFYFILICLLFLGLGHSSMAQKKGAAEKQTLIYKDTLALDFYEAVSQNPKQVPLIILVHGGGFSGGTRDGESEVGFCNTLAEMGYSVASISYRLTRKGGSFGCDCPAETKIETFVKASEDLADAVNFLIAQERLSFDRDKLILAGSSAGAETVLNTVFMKDHYAFRHIKTAEFSGVISFAGSVVNTSYITSENEIPTLLVHGMKDRIVPFATDPHRFCSTNEVGFLMLGGSESIANRLETLNTSYILAFDPEGNHDWAGFAYEKTELVHDFIEGLVLKSDLVQKKIQIQRNIESTEAD